MKRAEMDYEPPPQPTVGAAEAVAVEDEHASHAFLYVPDLSSRTGWASHHVPERVERQERRREVGFRR